MFRNTTLPFSRIIHSLDPSNTGKLNIFQNYCITMQILTKPYFGMKDRGYQLPSDEVRI